MAFQAGYDKGCVFNLDGGSNTTLNIRAWSWNEQVNKLVTTHTGSAGIAACIAGVLDGDGTIEANVDAAALPNNTAPGIVPGAKAVIRPAVGSSNNWAIHVMVVSVNWKSAVDGLVTYSANVALDSTTNTYTRPS